jgi:hypothetical protein
VSGVAVHVLFIAMIANVSRAMDHVFAAEKVNMDHIVINRVQLDVKKTPVHVMGIVRNVRKDLLEKNVKHVKNVLVL